MCANRADLSAFFYEFIKSLLEDLLQSLGNAISSSELTLSSPSTALYVHALQTLHSNHSFMKTVMLPLVDRSFRSDIDADIDTNSIVALIDKKIDDHYSAYKAKLTTVVSGEIKGVVGAMCRCSVNEKNLDGDELEYFEGLLAGLRDRGRFRVLLRFNCDGL